MTDWNTVKMKDYVTCLHRIQKYNYVLFESDTRYKTQKTTIPYKVLPIASLYKPKLYIDSKNKLAEVRIPPKVFLTYLAFSLNNL